MNLKGLAPEVPVGPPAPGRPEDRRLPVPEPAGPRPRARDRRRRRPDPVARDHRVAGRDPPEPPLLPADPGRAHARAFAQVIACDIHPLQNLRVLRYLKARFGQDQDGLDAWCRHWIEPGLAACEALLARRAGGGLRLRRCAGPRRDLPRPADGLGRPLRPRPRALPAAPRAPRPLRGPARLRRRPSLEATRRRSRLSCPSSSLAHAARETVL